LVLIGGSFKLTKGDIRMSECQNQRNILDQDLRSLAEAKKRRNDHRINHPKESKTLRRLNAKIGEWEGTVEDSRFYLNKCINGS